MLEALRAEWSDRQDLTASDIAELIAASPKRRHEMADGRIRALYGHSVPGKLDRTPSMPPERLHHGTSPKALESIRKTACSRWRASTCISPTIAPTHWRSDGASIRSRCVCA